MHSKITIKRLRTYFTSFLSNLLSNLGKLFIWWLDAIRLGSSCETNNYERNSISKQHTHTHTHTHTQNTQKRLVNQLSLIFILIWK